MKKIIGLIACVVLALGLAGCSSNSTSNEPDYADDDAMQIIADGWNKRSKVVENVSSTDDDYIAKVKEGIQAEIDNDAVLKDRPFEDSKMQENVIAYLNTLDSQLELMGRYSSNDLSFYTDWQKVYDKRSQLLKTFVNDYGMTVDAKYQDALDELLANGAAAEKKEGQKDALNSLIAGATWEAEEEYGMYTYTAVLENTSDYNFSNVSLTVNLYDADGVKTETYAHANNWNKGDKVKFEAYGNDAAAERVDATVTYYDVAE